jgi:hypothetical protein
MFNEIRQLSQAIIQNGGSLYDVIELYGTNSVRDLKRSFKLIKEKQEKLLQEQQDIQKQQLEQQQSQFEITEQRKQEAEMLKMENENYQNELERLNKKEIAIISASGYGQVEGVDKNNDGVMDVMELEKLNADRANADKAHKVKLADIRAKFTLGMEKLKVDKANQANDLAIAKENAKGRGNNSSNKK